MAAHETHHGDNHHPTEETPATPFRSSFWFVVILAGLFIAAVNFVDVMGHDDGEGHGTGHATEAAAGHGAHPVEATSGETMHGEAGAAALAHDTVQKHSDTAVTDSVHAEGHH